MVLHVSNSSKGKVRGQGRKLTSAPPWRSSAALSNSGFIFLQCPHPVARDQEKPFPWHEDPGDVPCAASPRQPGPIPRIWSMWEKRRQKPAQRKELFSLIHWGGLGWQGAQEIKTRPLQKQHLQHEYTPGVLGTDLVLYTLTLALQVGTDRISVSQM